MNIFDQLHQARADLATLEGDTSRLEAAVTEHESTLDAARRAARAGGATLEAVAEHQGRTEAARGLLAQHLHDVADARRLVTELSRATDAAGRVEEGREAHRLMIEARQAHTERAAQVEEVLRDALAELATLSQQHAQARARLGSALRAEVQAEQGGDPYRRGERLDATTDRSTGRAFLAEISPQLTEHDVLAPWGSELSTHEGRFPLLSQVKSRA